MTGSALRRITSSVVRQRGRRARKRQPQALWLPIPGAVLITVTIVLPLLVGVYFSLTDLDQYTLRTWTQAPFIWFGNFVEAVGSSDLLHAIWTSVSIAVLTTLVTIPLGLAAALATQNPFRGRNILRSLFLIPYVLPIFVAATVWRTLLQPDGIVNNGLALFGIGGVHWLNGPASYWVLVFVNAWQVWPFIYLMVLAGLQTVDIEVHEAAALDGALSWTKFRFIVFPYVRGPLALACLLATLWHINNFTLPFVLFGIPAPYGVEVLPLLVYSTTFTSFRFGLGAAMALVSLILIALPLYLYVRAVNLDRESDRERRPRRADRHLATSERIMP